MIFFEASRQLSEVVRRAIYSPGSHTCGKPCCASAASLLPSRLSGEWKAKMCKERTYRTGKVVGLQQTFSLWIICSPGRNMLWTGSEVQGVFGFRSNGENSPLALHVLNKKKNQKKHSHARLSAECWNVKASVLDLPHVAECIHFYYRFSQLASSMPCLIFFTYCMCFKRNGFSSIIVGKV